MKKLVLILILLGGSTHMLMAQQSNVLDGIYIREHTPARQVAAYPHLREGDVMWLKRVWREIDMRQKINHVLYYPFDPVQGRKNLFTVIIEAITQEGTLTAYSTGAAGDDDMFTQELTLAEVQSMMVDSSLQFTEDPDTGELIETMTVIPLETSEVKKYKLKEEWFFDNQRSVLDVRIIGMAPRKDNYDEDSGEFKGTSDMFWIYFPEAREVFKKADVFNRQNGSERRTFEDIFWKRQFASYITKESNVYDRSIAEYKTGLDALLEAQKIKDQIFYFEHDLWHF